MEKTKLPNGKLIYTLALLSCTLFCFGGITIVFALISYILARKSEKIYEQNPNAYSNISKIKKGKTIASYRSKTNYEEAYNILDTVVNKLGSNVSSGVASAYIFTVKKMLKNNKLNCSDMILAYTKVLNIVNENIEKKPKS